MKIETSKTDEVYISGDIPELGKWDPLLSHKLETNEHDYPLWISPNPIILDQGVKFQFKCVIMEAGKEKRWEILPNGSNRRYKAKNQIVTLKGTESRVEGSEVIEKVDNLEEKAEKIVEKLQNAKNSDMSASMFLDENAIYKKRNLDTNFNPFSFAESGSDDSEVDGERTPSKSFSSSFISLEHQDSQELIADKIHMKSQRKEIKAEKIEEIISPRTPFPYDNKDTEEIVENVEESKKTIKKTTGCLALNADKKLRIPDIFQQIKEKTKKVPTLVLKKTGKKQENPKDFLTTLEKNEPVIIVSRFLPIRVKKSENGWEVLKNEDIIFINLINTLFYHTSKEYENVIFVGWLKDDIAEEDREGLEQYLLKNHRCLPVYIDPHQRSIFENLYKHDEISVFDLVTNNYYIRKDSLGSFGQASNQRNLYWEVWIDLNRSYASKILKIMKEDSLVLICEYNLVLLPTYLIGESNKSLIALYFNINFPSFENFRLIPYKEEILNGLLSSSIICFNDYDHISEFFTTLSILKGIEYECKQGYTFLKYMGRKIYVKIKMPTIDPDKIDALKKTDEFAKIHAKTLTQFTNVNLILGVDPPSDLSGLEMKFLAFFQYVKDTKNKYHLKLIQFLIKNPYNSLFHSDLNSDYLRKIQDIVDKINIQYLELVNIENFPPAHQKKLIEIKDLRISEEEFISLLTIARVYLKTSIKSIYSLDVMSFITANRNFGYALVSEFLNLNKMCATILRFNPLRYAEFKDKMYYILHVKHDITALLQSDDLNIFKKSNTCFWLENLLFDLKVIGCDLKQAKLENIEKPNNLLSTKMMLLYDNFQYLPIQNIIEEYKKSKNRLILLDYEGTLVKYDYYTCITRTFKSYSDRFHMVSLKPDDGLIKDIMTLTQDPDNSLYVITGNKVEYLDHWFGHLIQVGLAAEYGFFYKNKGNTKWGNLFSMDWSWKEIVKKIFELYKKNTEGSEIESKDSCIAWKYHEVQQDFGKKQASALINHLKSSLEYFKQIEIFQGNNYIEVRPKGINKGTAAEILMTKLIYERDKIDFILCVGDGLSDEEMFISIKNHMYEKAGDFSDNFEPFTCVIGKKPSQAFYYLNNVNEVLNLLHLLKEASE